VKLPRSTHLLIFARTKQEAGNYRAYATKVLEEEMKLTVNKEKTSVTCVNNGVSYLGFVIYPKWMTVNPKRIKRFKDKVRRITRRSSGRPIEKVIRELNPVLRGWMNYYRAANIKGLAQELMAWIRRRLRMIRMKQWKTYKKMHKEMRRKGFRIQYKMDVRRWKNSKVQIIHMLMPNQYFQDCGLIDLRSYDVGLLSNYRE
jgi:RNA-directed DNA polymerase